MLVRKFKITQLVVCMLTVATLSFVDLFLGTKVVFGDATDYPAIGPLPQKKVPRASEVEMGKRLFFDARISGDGALSCATCHDPENGFTTTRTLSEAYPGTDYFRNSLSLINTRYKEDFADVGWGWEGRLGANLNDVIRDQLTESTIMNMDMRIMHERMKQDPVYVKMCAENYGSDCSSSMARKALVAFVESLVIADTAFDRGELSRSAKKGRKLFEGKAQCITCHNGPYFSDGKPHNTGIPEDLSIFTDPVRHLTYRSVLHTYGVPNMKVWRRDVGYFLVSKNYDDVGKFITPTLREISYTAPYMHNGALNTLAEVVEYYNSGGNSADDPMQVELEPLGLSSREKRDLLSFLESLSSENALTKERMSIPQSYEPIPNWLETKN